MKFSDFRELYWPNQDLFLSLPESLIRVAQEEAV